jgi:hypothetical protein
MLGEVIEGIVAAEQDLEILEDLPPNEGVIGRLNLRADVVILGLRTAEAWAETGRTEAAFALLQEHPRMRIVGLSSDGRSGFLYALRPSKRPLGELAPESLLAVIRETPEGP